MNKRQRSEQANSTLMRTKAMRTGKVEMPITRRTGLIASAAFLSTSRFAGAQQPRDVSIGLASSSFATAALRIAHELGLVARHGINPKFVVTESSGVALTGVISKSFDLAIIGLPELVLAQARGQKIVSIAMVYGGFATSMVLSKVAARKIGVAPTAPVKQRLKALDGLLIATPSATAGGTVAFKSAAQAEGANVRLTYMAQPAMQAALETGAIDGYLSSAPFWAFPVVKGDGHVWISGPKGDFPSISTPTVTALLVARREFAEANSELMNVLKTIVADLGKAIEQRPDEVKRAVGRLYPELSGAALDLLFDVESLSWNGKQMNAADMAREISMVKAIGVSLPPLIDSIEPATMLFP
jgi:ABC-type nitrate/sulfonate/bicarbonate transport system substrate-binding protein